MTFILGASLVCNLFLLWELQAAAQENTELRELLDDAEKAITATHQLLASIQSADTDG